MDYRIFITFMAYFKVDANTLASKNFHHEMLVTLRIRFWLRLESRETALRV